MSSDHKEALIRKFVDALNQGNLDVIDDLIDRNFFNHVPGQGEETAPEILHPLLGDMLAAFPDLKIQVGDFINEGDYLTFSMTIRGTHTGNLWGAPGAGKAASWTSVVTSRCADGKFAFEWKGLPMPGIMRVMRELGLVPPPEDMDKPSSNTISIPEFLLKVFFTGQVAEKECAHLDRIQVVEPDTDECQDCVALGDVWPALRMCLICGYVGCCDTSKNKHMKQHYQKTGHPVFRSIRMQESWVWCYEDDAFFSGNILTRNR